MTAGVTGLVRFAVAALVALVLAVVMVRLLHTTDTGIRIVDIVPDGWWSRYHKLFGFDRGGNVERMQDADALAIGIVCLTVTGAMVAGVMALLRRR
jgi:hypothetical protein